MHRLRAGFHILALPHPSCMDKKLNSTKEMWMVIVPTSLRMSLVNNIKFSKQCQALANHSRNVSSIYTRERMKKLML